MFQFTRPRGARHRTGDAARSGFVSIHAPTRGATSPAIACGTSKSFQFTRPRGARHAVALFALAAMRVSIHAPTRGATRWGRRRASPIWVSIHAPTRGATEVAVGLRRRVSFNSRAHEGRDGSPSASWRVGRFQFTRPRGARLDESLKRFAAQRFNSRAHEGRDVRRVARTARPCAFQFTRPRGARPGRWPLPRRQPMFQFTRPRGARRPQNATRSKPASFQFTRPRGARRYESSGTGVFDVSIHAPTRGATWPLSRARHPVLVSIHAPTRGATACPCAERRS